MTTLNTTNIEVNNTVEAAVEATVKETFGSSDVRTTLAELDTQILMIDDMASEALKAGDRKGVLMAMRVSATLERARKSVKRSLDRANRVRKGKAAPEADDVDDADDDDDV